MRARLVVKKKRMYVNTRLIEQEVNVEVPVCVVDECIGLWMDVYVRSKDVVWYYLRNGISSGV
jgi:hypothetical protein